MRTRNRRWKTAICALSILNGRVLASPSVRVALRTSWPATPLLAEILESIDSESPDSFFGVLDAITDPEHRIIFQDMTPEATYQATLQTALDAGYLSESGLASAVRLNLALHASGPKIQAYYQHYEHGPSQLGSVCDGQSWVDWYGVPVCDLETLVRLVGHETVEPAQSNNTSLVPPSRPKTLAFDHIYPSVSPAAERPPHTAILYGSPASDNFRELHSYLLSLASGRDHRIEYVFRHMPVHARSGRTLHKTYLSGYGVTLDLKKMDYLAIDDRRTRGQESGSVDDDSGIKEAEGTLLTKDPILQLLEAYPLNSTADNNSPLTEDELLQIGFQTAQLIADSEEPLATLKQISQNFPRYATSISRRVNVNESVAMEIQANMARAQPGMSMIWINGKTVPETDINPFSLLRLLRKERGFVHSLTSLGLTAEQSIDLMTHSAVGSLQGEKDVLDGIFDASDRLEGGNTIVWWNDLEKDSRYASWPSSLNTLLRPLYPGQFHNVKLNLYNVVLVLDLSKTSSHGFIGNAVWNIINRNFPLRFGVVPMVETEDGEKMAKIFYYLIQTVGRAKTIEFIRMNAQTRMPSDMVTPTVNWNIVRQEFQALINGVELAEGQEPLLTFEEVVNSPSLDKVRAYTQRLQADASSSPTGHAFVNGKHFDIDDEFLRNMQNEISQQMLHLQQRIYTTELSDENAGDMSTYFYDLPTTAQTRNRYIHQTGFEAIRVFNLHELFRDVELGAAYVYPNSAAESQTPLTEVIIADFDSEEGLTLAREALISMDGTARIGFLHNPSAASGLSEDTVHASAFRKLLLKHHTSIPKSDLLRSLGFDVEDAQQVPTPPQNVLGELAGDERSDSEDDQHTTSAEASKTILSRLGLSAGAQAVLINGRLIGPFKAGEFHAADFRTLASYELRKRVGPVLAALADVTPSFLQKDRVSSADILNIASSILSTIAMPEPTESGLYNVPAQPRRRNYNLLDNTYTSFESGDISTALYQIAILVDPLSEAAQKWSSIAEWLSSIPDVFIKIIIHPPGFREVPLKRFYRFQVLPSLVFDVNGDEVPAMVTFDDLPTQPIYTLGMDVPKAWLARPREAFHDLDNIQLNGLSSEEVVEATYELDYLVIEGHARDTLTNSPPRGLQLQLKTDNSSSVGDTQIMANLGYLQFRATPGIYHLEIRPGRGKELFEMESVGNEGWDSPTVQQIGDEITLTDFEGLTVYPRLARIPGKGHYDVLADLTFEDDEPDGLLDSIASRIKSWFRPEPAPSTDLVAVSQQAEINVFTVASGLLYERFLSIMVLSVLRNTNSTVKFWFIENFLSPSFLEFIPHFAAAYNFQYELVTYKWPSWLRAQKEKQRIIWAYKILFLDVLFPMDLKKVIFVDADQIVRADLKELVDLDLHGAPYGYTPMGDDNTDMEGFRFWKTGYWKDFLKGLPYHISALYVVDLDKFRKMAAGDILRGHYQQLSADPNSLANLDQDLPNNLQREVPIFSLHEDWLWCETWCSKDRLHRAKTIDLCQNPLTKEPKLERARKIPEWEEYDAEVARLTRHLTEAGLLRSSSIASDVNALAGEVPPPPSAPSNAEVAGMQGEGDTAADVEGVVTHEEL
ncbi:glycosyltransferase family 24 protein [Punctularia strigosozonata HHB-11173 SS5]|uniref:glycosyltransferase family 24 protein n=1 Tax=Punctularia strigosozonata (strain HHB-11173) TaxID=741275 RepID=UPI00044179B0|nr:glycosyltransferase family 24 protein [Punctularia strigosozonata HHB-11173 SS5]EIN08165.1 glycosyltransferase family 24 protein [Punctularia strigosozonata HHB-11173 SS5]